MTYNFHDTLIALREFVPTLMPMLKLFTGKGFREKAKKQVYGNEHLLCDDEHLRRTNVQ